MGKIRKNYVQPELRERFVKHTQMMDVSPGKPYEPGIDDYVKDEYDLDIWYFFDYEKK